MNLFCFTLDGSSESIYEPPHNSSLKDVLPNSHRSPLLRRRPQWTGSDPNISYVQTPNNVRLKRNNRRSCIPTLAIENETSETDYSCWTASGLRIDIHHQETEVKTAACQSNTEDPVKEMKKGQPVQSGESAQDKDGATTSTSRRLKMFHDLVQAKKGYQSASGKGTKQPNNGNNSSDMLSNSNSAFTCISPGKRTEKSSRSDQQQQEEVENLHVDLKTEVVQNAVDRPRPHLPFYHTCHQAGHEMGLCEGNLVLPQASEWDRFESLIQELDRKESHLPPTAFAASTKDIPSTEDKLSIFGKLATPTEPPPFTKPQHNASPLSESKLSRRQTADSPRPDMRPVETTAEKKMTTAVCVDTQKADAKKRESGVMRILTEGRKLSSNSMESLHSRQSSSSGVTSDCSSNRDSLRLEDEPFCPRLFCGRARVHTDFMPSPYDTESLKLKVGDVIDIIRKRPMGIWTGMLNDKIGNFKFIYADELTEAAPETHEEVQKRRAPQKCTSTIHEVLRRLSLEEYSSSLQQNGYQTVDDLMRLREHHLTKLQVTDPEHRHRLLAAVESLQQLSSNCDLEKEPKREVGTPTENVKRDMRDSGCHMPSDSTDISGEDADLPFPCEASQPSS